MSDGRVALALGLAAVSLVAPAWPPSSTIGPAVLGLALLVGLPHGALDHAIFYRRRAGARVAKAWLRFHLFYVASALVFAGLLICAPLPGFGVFCIASTWHFGQSDLVWLASAHIHPLARATAWLSRGAFVVGTPILSHPEIAFGFIEGVVGQPFAWPFTVIAPRELAPMLILVHIAVLVLLYRRHVFGRRRLLEQLMTVIGLAAMFLTLDPLVGFAAYFVLWHSADHMNRAHAWLGRTWASMAQIAAPYTIAALLGVFLLGLLALGWSDVVGETTALRVLALTVAAVTFPHMAVVEVWIREHVQTPDELWAFAGQTQGE